jgi:hypothetical protein
VGFLQVLRQRHLRTNQKSEMCIKT